MARAKKIASQDEEGEEERIDSPIKPVQSSSDDSDSDSDDSADSENKTQAMTSAFTIKTKDDVDTAVATSKRKLTTTDTTTTAKKSKTQAMTSAFTIKTKDDVDTAVATSKRKLTTTDTTTTTKKSKKSAAVTSNNAKQPQRIWTDDYEISLLKGMVEYKKDKGTEPSGNLFFDFIKNYLTLNFELSKNQLTDKIYRLRKKYEANVEKAGYGEPVFDKPHDLNVFKLSKKIWSRDAAMTSAKGKVSETNKETKNPLPAGDYPATKKKTTKAKKDKVVKSKAKADVEINNKVDGNDVGEEVKENIWSKMFLSSGVVIKELEFPEFWNRFIKKRILKGDDMAKGLQENELELKLKKNEIQRKQYELELAQFRASQS